MHVNNMFVFKKSSPVMMNMMMKQKTHRRQWQWQQKHASKAWVVATIVTRSHLTRTAQTQARVKPWVLALPFPPMPPPTTRLSLMPMKNRSFMMTIIWTIQTTMPMIFWQWWWQWWWAMRLKKSRAAWLMTRLWYSLPWNDKHSRNSILEPRVRHLHMYVCVYVC